MRASRNCKVGTVCEVIGCSSKQAAGYRDLCMQRQCCMHIQLCVCMANHTYTTTPLYTVIMVLKHKSSVVGSATKPRRSHDVLSIGEKVKILDMIELGKK